MGIFNKLFGFRWSLYFVKNENQLAYAMHEHAVMRMAGYVMGYFADGGKPIEPWSLYLNFNHKNHSFKLLPEHFTSDGGNVTPLLIQKIESIDPEWKVKGGEPVFEEAATKKRIKIQESTSEYLQTAFSDEPRELTFFSIMAEIFDKSSQTKEPIPTAFESLAAICKFLAISKISPEFYVKHNHSIEIGCSFIQVLASNYPELNKAFREALPLPISDGAAFIERAITSISFSEEKIQWFDNQMTETLKTLLPVVRDSELPEWISNFKWAIEQAFHE